MYDYVIVGAGSAGCALAARLSEDHGVRVCLVEAGGPDTDPNVALPVGAAALFRSSADWDYDTHDEPHLDGRRLYLPRGRLLGGTSSLNGMVYMRGHPLDYDGWGRPGWTYRDLLPYFRRSEDNERGADAHHGVGGPLSVSDGRSRNPSTQAFVAAAIEVGHPFNHDFNDGVQDGFGPYQLTQRDGRRWSSADAFLRPALGRPNLEVRTHTQVTRVLLSGGRAVGVVARRLDEEVELRAAREVVLTGGSYNSPQLLMLSGIGPADELRALGIEVVLDQPEVGANLQDHCVANLVYTHGQPVSLMTAGTPENVREYAEHGTGPLSSNVPEVGGFARTRGGLAAPDVQFHACPVMLSDMGLRGPTDHAISFGACVLRPQSRGSVRLASAEPTAKPRIRKEYLREEADVLAAVEGLRIGMEIAGAAALRPYTARRHEHPASTSDADLRAFLRARTQTLFHPSGTCAMGTVVDDELRVAGIDGLRVADLSILPTLVGGNTNAPAIAIGERAADLIAHGRTGRHLRPVDGPVSRTPGPSQPEEHAS